MTKRSYTTTEERILKLNYSDTPNIELSKLLNRSMFSISWRAGMLGLKKSPSYINKTNRTNKLNKKHEKGRTVTKKSKEKVNQ